MEKSMRKFICMIMAVLVMGSLMLSGCGSKEQAATTGDGQNTTQNKKQDEVVVWAPPIEKNYEQNTKPIISKFESENPHIKIQLESVSWGESRQKFETALNAGNPPDLMFINPNEKYIDTGLALSIDEFIDQDTLADYYPAAVNYMKKEGKLYGLPLYMPIHSIGGNKKLLEEAGIDYKKIQQEGWTWQEFKEYAQKGTKTNSDGKQQYGMVFSASGVTAMELLEHMLANNGLTSPIDENGQYTYTDPRFLETLRFIVSLIDEGIMPAETNQITAQKRMEMLYTEQAMIVGKAIPYYEALLVKQNQEVKAGTAQEGFKEVEFVLLPEPHNAGQSAVTMGGADGFTVYRQKKYKGDEHTKNVVKVLVALTSNEAGKSATELYLPQITKSGDKLYADKYQMNPDNKVAVDKMLQNLIEPVSMSPEVAKKVNIIRDQVIAAKFPALLAREITPEEMYDAVKAKAKELFE